MSETKLTASDGAAGDGFGVSVTVNATNVVIGAIDDDDDGESSGSGYLFRVTIPNRIDAPWMIYE